MGGIDHDLRIVHTIATYWQSVIDAQTGDLTEAESDALAELVDFMGDLEIVRAFLVRLRHLHRQRMVGSGLLARYRDLGGRDLLERIAYIPETIERSGDYGEPKLEGLVETVELFDTLRWELEAWIRDLFVSREFQSAMRRGE